MSTSYDVIIVGGGVIGSAVAYFLSADPGFSGTILVVERDPTYEFCSTTRSWGGVRQQFSTAGNIAMARFNVDFVRRAKDLLAVDGEGPELGFRENGYLFLSDEAMLPHFQTLRERQVAQGAEINILSPDDLARRFPWLNLEGVAGGSFGERDEGWIDPYALLMGFRRKARSQGVQYETDNVDRLLTETGRVTGVELAGGGRISAGTVVLCGGWHSGRLAATAGIDLPVGPRKRMTYVFEARTTIADMPLTIDVTGLACRPEGTQYMSIMSPPEDQDPECDDFEMDYEGFEDTHWPILAHRIPAFEAVKFSRAWAGHYDYNHFDHNAVLGRHPDIGGILFGTGFSGHGIQQSPAVGRATAELIVHGRYVSLNLSELDYARIPEGRPIKEAAVV